MNPFRVSWGIELQDLHFQQFLKKNECRTTLLFSAWTEIAAFVFLSASVVHACFCSPAVHRTRGSLPSHWPAGGVSCKPESTVAALCVKVTSFAVLIKWCKSLWYLCSTFRETSNKEQQRGSSFRTDFVLFGCFFVLFFFLNQFWPSLISQSTCLHAREPEGREWRSLEKDTQITIITAF